MNPVREYIRFIDGGLASATSKNDVLRVDLLLMPLVAVATLTVLPAVILRSAGAAEVWGAIFGTIFIGLMALHILTLFWRWSIFDSADYTGTKRDPHHEDIP